MLLEICINSGDSNTDAAIRIAHSPAEHHGGPENSREDGEGDQRQPPLHLQHDDNDSEKDKDVLKDGYDARGEHVVKGIHIAGDASDEAPHWILVEESDVHVLEMAEYLATQIEHHLLARPQHEVGLRVFEDKTSRQRAYIHQRNLPDTNQGPGTEKGIQEAVRLVGSSSEVFIECNLGEIWANDICGSLENDGDQGNYYSPFVGTEISQEPLHQPAVIRFTQYLFFLHASPVSIVKDAWERALGSEDWREDVPAPRASEMIRPNVNARTVGMRAEVPDQKQ